MSEQPIEQPNSTERIRNDRGVIGTFVYWTTVKGWNEHASIMSLWPLHQTEQHRARDVIQVLMLVGSVISLICWGTTRLDASSWRALVAGFACYRIVDLTCALTGAMCFDLITEPVRVSGMPRRRLERHIVNTCVGYLELLLDFAIMYLFIDSLNHKAFDAPIKGVWDAIFLSMTTITTVGFGRISPVSHAAVIVATTQAMLVVLVVILFIANAVALRSSNGNKPNPKTPAQVSPMRILAIVASYAIISKMMFVCQSHFTHPK